MNLTEILNNFGARLLISIALIALLYFIRALINKLIIKKTVKLKERYIARQINNYVALVITVLIIIGLWFQWFQSIITFLSLAVAAILIVSKELILNFVAHGVIITRELFEAGDRIQVGNFSGDVMETGPLFFSISEIGNWIHGDEATGRIVKIPNSIVLTQSVANYSRGLDLIWDEIDIELNMKSDLKKAKQLGLEITGKYAYKFTNDDFKKIQYESEEVMFTTTEPSANIDLNNGKIILSLRYPVKFHKRRKTYQNIIEEIIEKFREEKEIELITQNIPG